MLKLPLPETHTFRATCRATCRHTAHLEVSVGVRLPGGLAADLLGHHAQQLVGGLHRGVDEPGHVAAARHRVVSVVLLLHLLHQILQQQIFVVILNIFCDSKYFL